MTTSWETAKVGNGEMRMFVARPDISKPAPGVIVLPEVFGINGHIQEVTTRISTLGYTAIAPELFHRTVPGFQAKYSELDAAKAQMNQLTNLGLEEDVRAAYDWLRADKQTDGNCIASVGFCLGGKVAFMGNAIIQLKGAVSLYGTGIPALMDDYASKQQAPLMLIWGGKDKLNREQRSAISDALEKDGKKFSVHEFSDAGHGFFCNEREAWNPTAAAEAWALIAAFFKNYLQ